MLEAQDRIALLRHLSRTPSDITIDAEDSLALRTTAARAPAPAGARIAIVRFPCMSNATDFRLLTWADWIQARRPLATTTSWCCRARRTRLAICSGCRRSGLAAWILGQHRRGATVLGICGGFQMMGRRIRRSVGRRVGGALGDRDSGCCRSSPVMTAERSAPRSTAATTRGGMRFTGYEIHMGETDRSKGHVRAVCALRGRHGRRCVPARRHRHLSSRRARESRMSARKCSACPMHVIDAEARSL